MHISARAWKSSSFSKATILEFLSTRQCSTTSIAAWFHIQGKCVACVRPIQKCKEYLTQYLSQFLFCIKWYQHRYQICSNLLAELQLIETLCNTVQRANLVPISAAITCLIDDSCHSLQTSMRTWKHCEATEPHLCLYWSSLHDHIETLSLLITLPVLACMQLPFCLCGNCHQGYLQVSRGWQVVSAKLQQGSAMSKWIYNTKCMSIIIYVCNMLHINTLQLHQVMPLEHKTKDFHVSKKKTIANIYKWFRAVNVFHSCHSIRRWIPQRQNCKRAQKQTRTTSLFG